MKTRNTCIAWIILQASPLDKKVVQGNKEMTKIDHLTKLGLKKLNRRELGKDL